MFIIALILILMLFVKDFPNGIDLLIMTFLFFIIFYKNKKILIKIQVLLYLLVILQSILIILEANFLNIVFIENGIVSISLLTYLMLVGMFDKNSKIFLKLTSTRKIAAIMLFLLITPHIFIYLFTDIKIFGVISYVAMIPLTLTSFTIIRREIDNKDWIMIQKLSYLVYISTYIHIIIVTDKISAIIYSSILSIYVYHKLNLLKRSIKK